MIKRVIFATLLLLSSNAMAEERIVDLIKVSDGDTIKVILDNEKIGVRLLEIDCFETSKNRRAIKQTEYYNISLGEVFKRGNYSKQKLKDIYYGITLFVFIYKLPLIRRSDI